MDHIKYMALIGKKGGQAKSEKKALAVRLNLEKARKARKVRAA